MAGGEGGAEHHLSGLGKHSRGQAAAVLCLEGERLHKPMEDVVMKGGRGTSYPRTRFSCGVAWSNGQDAVQYPWCQQEQSRRYGRFTAPRMRVHETLQVGVCERRVLARAGMHACTPSSEWRRTGTCGACRALPEGAHGSTRAAQRPQECTVALECSRRHVRHHKTDSRR